MEKTEIMKQLEQLIQTDVDAIQSYNQAIEKVEEADVKKHLMEFKSDHDRHIQDLSAQIKDLGGKAPEPTKDFKGFLAEKFTDLRGLIGGEEGVLKAMKSNEEVTNSVYDKAMALNWPDPIQKIIEKHRWEELKHLKYIIRKLEK